MPDPTDLLSCLREAEQSAIGPARAERLLLAVVCDALPCSPPAGSPLEMAARAGRQDAAYPRWAGLTVTVHDAAIASERLVDTVHARTTGATFTPPTVAWFLADQVVGHLDATGQLASGRVLDPAVGSGSLLLAMLDRLVARAAGNPFGIANRLLGIDINADSVRRARMLLHASAIAHAGRPGPEPTGLRVGNYLARRRPTGLLPVHAVIANPPYVRYQDLTVQQRADLSARYASAREGNFNLYFPFVEQMLTDVSDDGIAAFITPSGYLTSASGRPLRRWLAARNCVDRIVDFGDHPMFETASIYTAITVAHGGTRESGTGVGYVRASGLEGLSRLNDGWANRHRVPVPADGSRWTLVSRHEQSAVRAVAGQPVALADIADIRYGLATCRDRLYLLDGTVDEDGRYRTTYRGREYPIEPAATAPCVKVPTLENQAALLSARGRIVYPYDVQGRTARVWSEERLRDEFPLTAAYFDAIAAELATRDKGRKTYAAWFAYGRTQGLVAHGPKLLTPLYARTPRFLRADDPALLFVNGCSVTLRPSAPFSLDVVHAVLNSSVMGDLMRAVSPAIRGGYHAFQKPQLAHVRLPSLSVEQQKTLAGAPEPDRDRVIRSWFGR